MRRSYTTRAYGLSPVLAPSRRDGAPVLNITDLPNTDDLIVAVDTEGSGLYPDDGARISMVSIAYDDVEAAFPFDHGYMTWLGPKYYPPKYPGPSLFDNPDVNLGLAEWHALCQWLKRQQIIWHNGIHDLAMFNAGLRTLESTTGYDLGTATIWDTMVVAPLLWPNERVGLDAISIREFHAGKGDALAAINSWKKKYLGTGHSGRYDLLPDDLVIPYAKQDAGMTLRLFHTENRMIDEGLVPWEVVSREIDLMLVLYYAERTGLGFNVPMCLREDAKLAAMEQELMARFATRGIHHPTEDAMRVFWFDKLKVPVIEETKGGKPAVTVAVVRELVKQGVPGALTWQKLTKVQTARSMWYSAWPRMCGSDGRLRTRFRQTKSESDMRSVTNSDMRGTISGRLAVQRIQLQAIPHDYQIPEGIKPIRKMWTAHPGHVVIEIDVSQAEMRGVAGLSRCTGLLDRFSAGIDAHTSVAQMVFSVDEGHDRWDFYRNVSKRLNFGIVYGAGIDTLVAQIKLYTGVDVTHNEVQEWWGAAKRSMPEVFRLARKMQYQAEATRMVELVGGKIRYFRIGEFTHKAMNALIQGSVSVAMADSMIDIHDEFGPGRILLQIHDSVVLELPIEHAEPMRKRAQHIIESTFEGHFNAPFKTDWKEWTKAA